MSRDDIRQAIPHAEEAEQSVLGALLFDNDAIDRISDLKAEHFYRGYHRVIFAEIVGLIGQGIGADIVTVFERLAAKERADDIGGLPYLNALAQGAPSSANIARYADIVRDRAQKRGMLALASKMQDVAINAPESAAILIDRAQAELEALGAAQIKREPRLVADLMSEHLAVLERRSEGKVRVIPTGIPDLDRALSGGIRPGNVVTLGARPSVGKTALALSIAASMAPDYGVAVMSMEMQADEINDRLIALLGHVDLDRVLSVSPEDESTWQAVTRAAEKVAAMNLSIDDQPALTLLDLRNKTRLAKRKFGLDVLVVDYLQLMTGRDETEKRNYQLEEISRGVKALAKELSIGVIELVQLNRAADQRAGRYRMADIRDCGSIEQDADVIGFLHRPIKDDPELGSDWQHFAWLQIEKNRQGACVDVPLFFTASQTRFQSWAGPWPSKPIGSKKASRGFE